MIPAFCMRVKRCAIRHCERRATRHCERSLRSNPRAGRQEIASFLLRNLLVSVIPNGVRNLWHCRLCSLPRERFFVARPVREAGARLAEACSLE
jgi:hypothetical protein